MYLNYFSVVIITTFFSIHGSPLLDKSVYEMIKLTAGDANFKCPYLRTTTLLEPEPEYLSKCNSFKAALTLTTLTLDNVQDALCLLYYDNFEHLCYVSNNLTFLVLGPLLGDHINEIPKTYQKNVTQVCKTLTSNLYFIDDTKPGIEVIHRYFEGHKKCAQICSDFDDNVKPICSLTAFMINMTVKVSNYTQNLVHADASSEKGTAVKTKPAVIDHNIVDNQDDSKNLNKNHTDTQPEGQIQHSTQINNNLPSHKNEHLPVDQSPGSQTHLVSQNSESPSHDVKVNESKSSLQNQQAQQSNIRQNFLPEQSVEPNPQLSSSAPLVNKQDKNHAHQAANKVDRADELKSASTSEKNQVKDTPSKDQTIVVSPVSTDPKVEQSNRNHIGDADSKTRDDAKEIPQGDKPFDEQKTLGIAEKKEEQKANDKQNLKSLQNKAGEVLADRGNTQQLPAPSVEEQPRTGQDVGEQGQGARQSTDDDGGVEAAAESPQDKDPFLPEDPDDDLDSGLPNDANPDYSFNEAQPPQPSEVKTKPAEKSKPLETDEDGPSFSANYQNQSIDDSDSYFFSYFMMVCIMFICGYVAYHNKQKILALVVEGRKGRRPSRTRRPNSANYRKLDSNLEEAVTSSCNKNATQVIY